MVERQNRPAVQFLTNVPVEVALKWPDGKLINGVYGDRMMYTTVDDKVMFLDCDVAAQINELGVQPGELFFICKARGNGKGLSNYWKVWRETGEPATVAGESSLERDLRHSLAKQSPHGQLAVEKPKETPAPRPAAPPVNGNCLVKTPTKVPVNRAVLEAVRMVQHAMKETGEQWSDASKQDLVSTILITAQREGWMCMWESES